MSLKLEYFNCPKPAPLDASILPKTLPEFLTYLPDFDAIDQNAKEYATYKNLVIIGHGGSISTFYGIYQVWRKLSSKKVYFVSTVDPDYIEELTSSLSKADTLVVAISKSGETVTQIEALLQFTGYPLIVIAGKQTPLWQIGEAQSARLIVHPAIGGRYTGITEVALLPSVLCGFDARGIAEGAQAYYQDFSKDNSAWQAASVMFQLEQMGIVDVFMPIYRQNLFGFSSLIVQLCHESFGKAGLGQTYFAHEAPESQHHTNQRFFGGRKNIAGFFISSGSSSEMKTVVPPAIQTIALKDQTIADLGGINLRDALRFEMEGVIEHAATKNIPAIHMELSNQNPSTIGELIAFWQEYAVYSSLIRKVNPFDQPEVESSKQLSWEKRMTNK